MFKTWKKNEVADALSRRTYPDSPLEPEDIIPTTDVHCFTPVTEEKRTQPTFFYADKQRPFPSSIDVETVHKVDTNSINELQCNCPDFKDLYNYVKNKVLVNQISMYSSTTFSTIITKQDPSEHVIQAATFV